MSDDGDGNTGNRPKIIWGTLIAIGGLIVALVGLFWGDNLIGRSAADTNSKELAQYFKHADDRCAKYDHSHPPLPSDPTARVAAIREWNFQRVRSFNDWKSIQPPKAIENQVAAVQAAVNQALLDAEWAAQDLEEGRSESSEIRLKDGQTHGSEAIEKARAVGFKVCPADRV
ncbi:MULTISPECIES: hypothetical protein [Streptomyces]|uniref:hypothetical protein n=1 Tax=Streptomyces TaxID=1883 RepID=UPI00345B57F5